MLTLHRAGWRATSATAAVTAAGVPVDYLESPPKDGMQLCPAMVAGPDLAPICKLIGMGGNGAATKRVAIAAVGGELHARSRSAANGPQ